jgi:hypothetical protein
MTHTEEYEKALKELTSRCEYCEQEYLMVKATQKYCSFSCKNKRYYRESMVKYKTTKGKE